MADESSESALRGRDLIGLGGLLAGSVIAFTLLGLLVDNLADTSPVFTMVGVGLGIAFGAFGFWARVRAALRG
jgi:F0F1-type ATP synthase assembly protein I